ncbi:MAG: tetratricopeptide repeat protein [Gaiellaceae bacterium]
MFVFLAAVFAVGFVAFGVGSDVQGGVADVIGLGGGGSDQPSVDDAREKLEKTPNDPAALRELATALQTAGTPEEAIDPLESFTAQRPRDEDALRELAGLYLTKASRLRDELRIAQLQAQGLNPGADFLPPATTPLGQALSSPPISQAVTARASERVNAVFTELTATFDEAKTTYEQIVRLAPEDASLQLQLADAAQNAGDAATAIAAYEKFLELAPDDPSAPLVKKEIERLEATAALDQGAAG